MPRSRGIKSIRIIRSICHTFSWHYYDNNIFHNRNSLSVLIEKVFILSLLHRINAGLTSVSGGRLNVRKTENRRESFSAVLFFVRYGRHGGTAASFT